MLLISSIHTRRKDIGYYSAAVLFLHYQRAKEWKASGKDPTF